MFAPQILEIPEGVASTTDEDQRFSFLVFGDFKGFERAQGKDKIKGTVGLDLLGVIADHQYHIRYDTVYVRQLSGSLRANDRGWDTPWVGLDTSGIDRRILLVTVLLLPVTASAVLDYQFLHRMHGLLISGAANVWTRRCASTAGVLALLASVFLAVLS